MHKRSESPFYQLGRFFKTGIINHVDKVYQIFSISFTASLPSIGLEERWIESQSSFHLSLFILLFSFKINTLFQKWVEIRRLGLT